MRNWKEWQGPRPAALVGKLNGTFLQVVPLKALKCTDYCYNYLMTACSNLEEKQLNKSSTVYDEIETAGSERGLCG